MAAVFWRGGAFRVSRKTGRLVSYRMKVNSVDMAALSRARVPVVVATLCAVAAS
jgi:hypothetical protein